MLSAETERIIREMTAPLSGQKRWLNWVFLHLVSLCKKSSSSILNNNRFQGDEASAYLWSDPAVRSLPRCHSDLSETSTADRVRDQSRVITCLRNSTLAAKRHYTHNWIEFFRLTSHPKTPDRTAAEAGRHVSRNIHNTGNFGASREKTDNRVCRDIADADFLQDRDQLDPP